MDKVTAQRTLGRIRRLWFSKRKSLAAIIKEVLTNEASVLVDSDAANKSADADAALQELGADFAGFRSEEHTSELQSLMRLSSALFCLKKKKSTSISTLQK